MSLVSLFVLAFALVTASADGQSQISSNPSQLSSDLDVFHKIIYRDVGDDEFDINSPYNRDVYDEERFGIILPTCRLIKRIIHRAIKLVINVLLFPKRLIVKVIRVVKCVLRLVKNVLFFPIRVLLFPVKVILSIFREPPPTYPTPPPCPTYLPPPPKWYPDGIPPKINSFY